MKRSLCSPKSISRIRARWASTTHRNCTNLSFKVGEARNRMVSSNSPLSGISVASYNVGCFFGAISTIWIGNMLGRRKTIFLGSSIMVIGATLQCTSFGLPQFIIGRLVTGYVLLSPGFDATFPFLCLSVDPGRLSQLGMTCKMLTPGHRYGNGLNTSTVPTWQSECSKSHKRGQLVMIEVAQTESCLTVLLTRSRAP